MSALSTTTTSSSCSPESPSHVASNALRGIAAMVRESSTEEEPKPVNKKARAPNAKKKKTRKIVDKFTIVNKATPELLAATARRVTNEPPKRLREKEKEKKIDQEDLEKISADFLRAIPIGRHIMKKIMSLPPAHRSSQQWHNRAARIFPDAKMLYYEVYVEEMDDLDVRY